MTLEIENKTPWDTEGLKALVSPLIPLGHSITQISFENMGGVPGVKREDAKLFRASFCNSPVTRITLNLATPGRVKKRMTALDRLAYTRDLEPHEVPLPVKVIQNIVHTIRYMVKNPTADYNDQAKHSKCLSGKAWSQYSEPCRCDKDLGYKCPVIAGNTKARVRPPKTAARLDQELSWVDREIGNYEEKLTTLREKRERLQSRLEKARDREAKARV